MEDEEIFKEFVKWEKNSMDCIDVKRTYIDISGDLVTGILLSSLLYWFLPAKNGMLRTKLKKNNERYIAKNRGDFFRECRLTCKQVDRAIRILKGKGFIKVFDGKFGKKRTLNIFLCVREIMDAIKKLNEKELDTSDNHYAKNAFGID